MALPNHKSALSVPINWGGSTPTGHKASGHNESIERSVRCSTCVPSTHGHDSVQHEDHMLHSERCVWCQHRQRKTDPDFWCNPDPTHACARCHMNLTDELYSDSCIICDVPTTEVGTFRYHYMPHLADYLLYCYSTCTVRICGECNALCHHPAQAPAGWDCWDVYNELEDELRRLNPDLLPK